jgi:hypothetical protein
MISMFTSKDHCYYFFFHILCFLNMNRINTKNVEQYMTDKKWILYSNLHLFFKISTCLLTMDDFYIFKYRKFISATKYPTFRIRGGSSDSGINWNLVTGLTPNCGTVLLCLGNQYSGSFRYLKMSFFLNLSGNLLNKP